MNFLIVQTSVQTDGHMKLAILTGACHEHATTFLSVQKVCRQMGAHNHLNVLTLHLLISVL